MKSSNRFHRSTGTTVSFTSHKNLISPRFINVPKTSTKTKKKKKKQNWVPFSFPTKMDRYSFVLFWNSDFLPSLWKDIMETSHLDESLINSEFIFWIKFDDGLIRSFFLRSWWIAFSFQIESTSSTWDRPLKKNNQPNFFF